MNKLTCKLTGGHKYDINHIVFFEDILTNDIELCVRCAKCHSVKIVARYPRETFFKLTDEIAKGLIWR